MEFVLTLFFIFTTVQATEADVDLMYEAEVIDHYLVFKPKKNQYLYAFLNFLGVAPAKRMKIIDDIVYFNRDISNQDIVLEGQSIYIPKHILLKEGVDISPYIYVERQPASLSLENKETTTTSYSVETFVQFSSIDAKEKSDAAKANLSSDLGLGFKFKKTRSEESFYYLQYLRESFEKPANKSLEKAESDRWFFGYGTKMLKLKHLDIDFLVALRQVNHLLAKDSESLVLHKANVPMLGLDLSFNYNLANFLTLELNLKPHYYFSHSISYAAVSEILGLESSLRFSLLKFPNLGMGAHYEEINIDSTIHQQRNKDLYFFIDYEFLK